MHIFYTGGNPLISMHGVSAGSSNPQMKPHASSNLKSTLRQVHVAQQAGLNALPPVRPACTLYSESIQVHLSTASKAQTFHAAHRCEIQAHRLRSRSRHFGTGEPLGLLAPALAARCLPAARRQPAGNPGHSRRGLVEGALPARCHLVAGLEGTLLVRVELAVAIVAAGAGGIGGVGGGSWV